MSSTVWIIIIVLALTLLGTLTLVFITVKYYWGERGTPPLTGEQRRRQREEEIRLRARQLEYAKQNPIATRKSDFWDNSKVYKDENTR
jgi:lipoprotein-anchoring transpeptidase ErfK/SrfK